MNIILLHYAAPPVVGGVESVLRQHSRLLTRAGHTVRILAGRGAAVDPEVEFAALARLDSRHPDVLAVKAALDQGRVPPEFDALTDQIVADLAEHLRWADVVIAHNVASLHKSLPLTAALHRYGEAAQTDRTAARLVLWHHDLAWTAHHYQTELYPRRPWTLLREDWPGVRHVVVSELRQAELSALLGLPPECIRVVPNGVDLAAFFKLEAQTQALLPRLDLLAADPLLLLPVRLTPRKNIELALRTLRCLRAVRPQARLLVTGPLGPHNPANRKYLARLLALRRGLGLEDAAIFLAEQVEGYLPDAVIADCYRLADALLLPSREEGFGIPVLEAGLAGLPIFCSDIAPLRALGGAEAAYFAPDAAPQSVAALIDQRLAADPVARLRGRVRREYSWEGIYQRCIAPLLEEVSL